ncbi:alpha-(1,3)-fucosyltransferase C [Elysia marginata]|uniref:Fucosyltransferase n=1 Tax=Elysia marginata TaxID=1093978 RepID=A0AAV4J5R1_9GAST|nr:alpha-(1,3)-fucosyltransferase C [Elysia marginata]
MVMLVNQKNFSSSPPTTASTATLLPPLSPSPSSSQPSLVAADRPWCSSRWGRVRAVLTAVVLCALTALFIQQTEYARRWKPAVPLGLGDKSQYTMHLSDRLGGHKPEDVSNDLESKDTTSEDVQYKVHSSFKDKKNIDSIKGDNTRINKERRHKGDRKEIFNDIAIEKLPENYKRKKTLSSSDVRIANVASGENLQTAPQEDESKFNSPLIVTEEEWPRTKHYVPIPLKTALGLRSSKETSSDRPISIAYIRFCIHDDPKCLDDTPMNFKKRCPYPGLVKTDDWNSADIVVISVWRMRNPLYVPKIRRPPGQIWVMLSVEAPSRKKNHKQLDFPGLKGQFNLTMSYRLDADIPYPYGHLQRNTDPEERDLDAVYSNKRFQAAWLVSHCQTTSKREDYVERLQAAGLEIHIYGTCGNYSCDGGKIRSTSFAPDSVCLPHLSKNYFFYLSFENSLCKDYITEKVFKIYDSVDMIPVVMGGADYNKFLPPRTFLNVADFESPRALARYLKRLANDKRRYLRMLREKNKWRRIYRQPWFCALGEKLATGLKPRVLHDTRAWYVQDQCSNNSLW